MQSFGVGEPLNCHGTANRSLQVDKSPARGLIKMRPRCLPTIPRLTRSRPQNHVSTRAALLYARRAAGRAGRVPCKAETSQKGVLCLELSWRWIKAKLYCTSKERSKFLEPRGEYSIRVITLSTPGASLRHLISPTSPCYLLPHSEPRELQCSLPCQSGASWCPASSRTTGIYLLISFHMFLLFSSILWKS